MYDKITKFVLHEHLAKKAGKHYDLRLQYLTDEKLMSFAIPKAKIPTNTKEKVMMIQTYDHDPYWLNYQGIIEDGEYGAGKIKILQNGNAIIHGWGPRMIVFSANGKYLNGKYILIRVRSRNKFQRQWLLSKGIVKGE